MTNIKRRDPTETGMTAWSVPYQRRQRVFLPQSMLDELLVAATKHGLLTKAADEVGIEPKDLRHLLKVDAAFAEAWHDAIERHTDTLEVAAYERAVVGFDKPIIGGRNKDEIVAYERVYSDSLLSKLLTAKRREQFGEKIEVNATVTGGVVLIPMSAAGNRALSPDEWEAKIEHEAPAIDGESRELASQDGEQASQGTPTP